LDSIGIISIKNYFDYGFKHDILNINTAPGKIKIINDKGSLYQSENYLYMLYFNLLTYEDKEDEKVFSFDNNNFIFKLFTEIVNRQDCYVFAHLLNKKSLNNIKRENNILKLIGDILDKIDYHDNVSYKINKLTKNTNVTNIEDYKNKYELDPRNILLIFKLFILYTDNKGNYKKNRIESGLKILFELIQKHSKFYNYCIIIIDFIISLFSCNKILIKDYVKQFKKELEFLIKWIKENPISPKLYMIEGLSMYRDDNITYQQINDQQKNEFDKSEKNSSNIKINQIENILKQKANENDNLIDYDLINISEFTFKNEEIILFDGKPAIVKEHLNEMIKIKFEKDKIDIKEINNDKGQSNIIENKFISKLWIDVENERIKINKLNL